jgi:hypothetical protein
MGRSDGWGAATDRKHEDREVPGDDLSDDADGLVPGVAV